MHPSLKVMLFYQATAKGRELLHYLLILFVWEHRMIRLKVKEIMEQKNVSIGRLSRLADVDIKIIRKIHRTPEKANVRLETLNKLAYALKVDARELFDYERDAFLPGISEEEEG